MTLLALAAGALLLAYANGANDNFKGVATLFGSGTAGYRRALAWATATTLAGSVAAAVLARGLVETFSGAGLVPDGVAADPAFLAAAAVGAAATVLLAARLGIPISTTHALTGALVGAGLSAGGGVALGVLGRGFFLPLVASPFMAFAGAAVLYPFFRRARLAWGIDRESCVCVGTEFVPVAAAAGAGAGAAAAVAVGRPVVVVARDGCPGTAERYRGEVAGVSAQVLLDSLHFLSAGALSFARGLNDTPKIVAVLVGASALGLGDSRAGSFLLVGLLIALGGGLAARRVGETMSRRITPMNAGQGFTANLVSSFLVIVASRWGLPVSTTHVSCGALFGIGAATAEARWRTIGGIAAAWVATLPLAAVLAAAAHRALA